ncbi:hypothetical protein GGR54DRAFT_236426 [Hypoxylon sp. NC1633]|nr:hypothetical protein GGR54DRAFT_236426 [Hypoxylon sp. NC1633]
MPPRRALPTLSISSRQSTSAPSTSPAPTAGRPNSIPLTPPARLHLRNLLASTPDGMPTPPPPPRKPYPWLWQCHSCSTVYRIGCTRRCLVCSHEYCVSATPQKTPRGKKRRRASGICASEFDYSGWEEWGAWCRKVLGVEATGRAGKQQRERAFVNRTHNCLIDCDFPSECLHERHRLQMEAFERNLVEEVPEPQSPSIVASAPLSPDDELEVNEALDVRERKDGKEERQKSPTSPRSPLSQTSFFWDESDEEEKGDERVWWIEDRGREKEHKSSSQQRVTQRTSDESNAVDKTSSSAVDDDIDSEMLNDFSGEEISRCRSREHPKHSSKLTVRNLTDADKLEEWDDSTDSDSDGSSPLSSPSSTSSFDSEWLPTFGLTPASEVGSNSSSSSSKAIEDKSEEELEEELKAMIEAEKSFLRV